MGFADPVFLFYFLPAALVVHAVAVRAARGRCYGTCAQIVLLILTLIFYGYHHPWWIAPFLITAGVDYAAAIGIARSRVPAVRRVALGIAIAQNLGTLAFFKYSGAIGAASGTGWLVPAGISFYTFEALSFVIDVYRGQIAPPRELWRYLGFLGQFPRFLAGPIVRFQPIAAQFDAYPGMRIERGLAQFIGGLFLKIGFADQFGYFARYAFDRPGAISVVAAWLGVAAFSLQLYFDFQGYSTMACGLGLCFGFEFGGNFDRPYLAASVTDFWRRWHISLGHWIRDYVFTPLALRAGRWGSWTLYPVILVTLVLFGWWHGPSPKFLLMGLWFGAVMCAEQALSPRRLPTVAGRAVTGAVVMSGWVLFRARDLGEAGKILSAMWLGGRGHPPFQAGAFAANPIASALCAAGLVYCFALEGDRRWAIAGSEARPFAPVALARALGAALLLVLSLLLGLSAPVVPFLYFQF